MKRHIPIVCAALLVAVQVPAPVTAAGLQDLQQFSDAFAELAAGVKPAVVAIKTEKQISGRRGVPLDEFFRGHPFLRSPEGEGGIREGLGSGVIVSKDGYILTNNHVITNGRRGDDEVADRIIVEMADLRSFEAEVVGRDPNTDLAVLKIQDGDDLPFLELGEADEIDVGEWVVAIGNPFGQLHTVTTGIISALGRGGSGLSDYEDYIQTDAAINPGNSGGPLVNALGEVVGINSFIYTGGEYSLGSIGIGFAIPAASARLFLDEIRTHGRVRVPWHGIADLQDLTPRLAEYLELDSTEGAVVVRVTMDGPAEQAGLGRGDVILSVNGEAAATATETWSLLQGLRVDQECEFEVVRRGKRQLLKFSVAERPGGTGWN